jgi:cathepsin B
MKFSDLLNTNIILIAIVIHCLILQSTLISSNNLNSKSEEEKEIYESKFQRISREYLEVASLHSNFKVLDYENHPFANQTFADLKKRFRIFDIPLTENGPIPEKDPNLSTVESEKFKQLPTNFDPNTKWPTCIHPIRNQAQCGACWAFAVTDVLADRLCIATDTRINVILSPQDPLSCSTDQLGCDGGFIERSWQRMVNVGAVTSSCFPYSAGSGYIEPCRTACKNSLVIWRRYRASSYRRFAYISEIRNELFEYGPIETGFLVYLDFMNYASGIYRKNSDYLLGGHAVKVIGWGYDTATTRWFWISANSWGMSWGENGFFRFEMSHCCNFESQMIAGYARLTKSDEDFKNEFESESQRLFELGKNLEQELSLE